MGSSDLSDQTQAISILAGVLSLFLALTLDRVKETLSQLPPDPAQEAARRRYRGEVTRVFWLRSFPLFVGFAVLCWICLPESSRIIGSSHLAAWDFELLPTVFVLLTGALAAGMVLALSVGIGLLSRWRQSR